MSPTAPLEAGFSKENITPPIGTRMMGWWGRDKESGCKEIVDPLHVRALYLRQGTQEALLLTYDLCALTRVECDRFKGALGTRLNLAPRQILIATSHTHAGPATISTPCDPSEHCNPAYVEFLLTATLHVSQAAKAAAQPAKLSAGVGTTTIPMNRRRFVNGTCTNAPNPGGVINNALPVCRLTDRRNRPIALLFSIAAHPVVVRGWRISADFPGVAMTELAADHAMFFQGTGADTRPALLARGTEWDWESGPAEAQAIGQTLAAEVRQVVLKPVQSQLRTAIVEMNWPLQPVPSRQALEAETQNPAWAKLQLDRLRYGPLPTYCPVLLHGIQLGTGLRLVALEGEPVAAHGLAIQKFYPRGVTFALGYANSMAMYLPTSKMLDEGGYEATCFALFGHAAPPAKGMERRLQQALAQLQHAGI